MAVPILMIGANNPLIAETSGLYINQLTDTGCVVLTVELVDATGAYFDCQVMWFRWDDTCTYGPCRSTRQELVMDEICGNAVHGLSCAVSPLYT